MKSIYILTIFLISAIVITAQNNNDELVIGKYIKLNSSFK